MTCSLNRKRLEDLNESFINFEMHVTVNLNIIQSN